MATEIRRAFSEVLSQEQLHKLHIKCNYDENDSEQFFEYGDFINGISLISHGERDFIWGDRQNNIINTHGDFIDVVLNNKIKYSNGKIVKLDKEDRGSYFFEISRILEKGFKYIPFKGLKQESDKETGFLVIKVTRYSNVRNEEDTIEWFVINPQLKVIASFSDLNTFGEFDGYKHCNIYTEREFFFINEEREFIVFSQKLMANSNENGFLDEHLYGIDPNAYEEIMREYDPCFDSEYYEDDSIDEIELDDSIMDKIIAKYNDALDDTDEEFNDIPDISDVNFFFEDTKNTLYNDVFTEYYKVLYGIIDCRIKSVKQLMPFTDKFSMAYGIIWDRKHEQEEQNKFMWYQQRWDYCDQHFNGYILDSKFLKYPPRMSGLTLKYMYKFYPNELKKLSDDGLILIPNKLLDTLGNNELVRFIRLNQETHLSYKQIYSASDPIISSEYNGIISSYQGKTINQIIYTKGGTKHIVGLLRSGKLDIEKSVIIELLTGTDNDIEKKCYQILLDVIENIEFEKERYNDWVQSQWDGYEIKEANREFNDMMNDFDAWGNID